MSASSSRSRALLSRTRLVGAALALATVGGPVVSTLTAAPAQAAEYGQLILNSAATHYGQPYVYGATGPSSFDCSGFTGYIYAQFGVALPRTSSEQYTAVPHVAQGQQQTGDLIFFYDGGGIYHVGLYAGDNQVYAATSTGDVVRPETIWTSQYLVGRPVLGGDIGAHWQALGGQYSVLGEATDVEYGVPNAREVDYQLGAIYWTPGTGAQEVHGAIGPLYTQTGSSAGYLGLPTTDEHAVLGGRANAFTAGAIFWSPATDAHAVHGLIAQKYTDLGGSNSFLGLPTADEAATPGGRVSTFQFGNIYWGPVSGAASVHGAILARYLAMRGPAGPLGLPTSDERATPDGRENVFQHGILRWNATTGAVTRVAR